MDSDRIKEKLGTSKKITLFRYRKRMSLMDLGAEVDLSRQTLSHYERGDSVPDLVSANAIANALKVDIKDLLPGEIEITSDESKYLEERSPSHLHVRRILDSFKKQRD